MPILRRNKLESQPFPAIVDAEVVPKKERSPRGEACVSCGAPLGLADHFCTACGHGHSPLDPVQAEVAGLAPSVDPAEQKFFRCRNCGSEVATDPGQRSYTCPFCDSNYVVEFSREESGRRPPDFIIGFTITPEEAREKFQQWIAKNSWFRPGDLSRAQLADKIKGVYLPFWGFSMLAQSRWAASIGEHWWRTETYTTRDDKGKTVTRTRRVQETEWWPLSGRHHHYYSGYMVSGSRGLAQQEADRIKPFQLPAMQRYEPYYLAGWMSEEYSVMHDDALEICQAVFLQREKANVAAFLPGDTYRNLDVHTAFSHINSDLCLLPAYVLGYHYKDKLFRFLVNGQTGNVAGEKPVSATRITVVTVVVVAILIAVVLLIGLLNR